MNRNVTTSLLALALCASASVATAGDRDTEIETLADASGLTERQVHMLFAPARSSFAEYRYSYDRTRRQFIAAMGEVKYLDLQAGREVIVDRVVDGQRVVSVVRLQPST